MILIPTPALSELPVHTEPGAAQTIVDVLSRDARFRIESFDSRAAIEVAAMLRAELKGGKKKVPTGSTWAKVKYDRQIIAIAVVNQAERIYSDDGDIRALARRCSISVVGVGDLPLPPEDEKQNLDLFERAE